MRSQSVLGLNVAVFLVGFARRELEPFRTRFVSLSPMSSGR